MNNTIKSLLAAAILSLVINPANAGVKVIGTLPNGDKIVRIKTLGVFAPATTTVLVVGKNPGEISVLNQAGGPGVVPAVANAGGLVGAAAVLRPARTSNSTTVEQTGGSNVNAPGGTSVTTGNNSFVPPGQVNNPGNGH